MQAFKVSDIMTAPVYTLSEETDLATAAAFLADKSITGALITTKNQQLVGVISKKDFLRSMGAGQDGSFMQVVALCLQNKGCIALMHLTKTLHPPGGATALIAVIGGDTVHQLGYLYVIIAAGMGALIMLVVALLINNIPDSRRYPEYWF